jgi:hypothetical protein
MGDVCQHLVVDAALVNLPLQYAYLFAADGFFPVIVCFGGKRFQPLYFCLVFALERLIFRDISLLIL